MKKRSLLSLIIPLCALSGCSYRGDYKPLRDGTLLFSDSFVSRDDTFEEIDLHMKALDTFCVYLSLDGCSSCAKFEEGFKVVNQENKVLTFQMESPRDNDDLAKLLAAYPDFNNGVFPALFIADQGKVEYLPYDKVNSESRLRNTLKRKISLVDHYFFGEGIVDFAEALEKTEFTQATLIELDFANANQVSHYKTAKAQTEGPIFIHQKAGLLDIKISTISK